MGARRGRRRCRGGCRRSSSAGTFGCRRTRWSTVRCSRLRRSGRRACSFFCSVGSRHSSSGGRSQRLVLSLGGCRSRLRTCRAFLGSLGGRRKLHTRCHLRSRHASLPAQKDVSLPLFLGWARPTSARSSDPRRKSAAFALVVVRLSGCRFRVLRVGSRPLPSTRPQA